MSELRQRKDKSDESLVKPPNFCSKCGEKLANTSAKFCGNCGTPVTAQATPTSTAIRDTDVIGEDDESITCLSLIRCV